MGTPPDGVREMRGQLRTRSGEIDGGGQVADPRGGEPPMRNRGMSQGVGLTAPAGAIGRDSTTLPPGVGGIAEGSHAGAGPGGRDPQVRRGGGSAMARGAGPGPPPWTRAPAAAGGTERLRCVGRGELRRFPAPTLRSGGLRPAPVLRGERIGEEDQVGEVQGEVHQDARLHPSRQGVGRPVADPGD